tara:strand:+ start:14035 stop:15066 length:1032 start_codon:yes stop_codon:yes gene_type:complete
MKTHTKFPKIVQYRQAIQEIKFRNSYTGKDSLGNPIYDETVIHPTLTFSGTVKMHGTNSSVAEDCEGGEFWAQSKGHIVTVGDDNYGFAKHVEEHKEAFKELIEHVRYNDETVNKGDGVAVFGEWAGEGIQKGVAITGIPKSFFIFDVKITPENGDDAYYVDSSYLNKDENARIYNIEDYVSYKIDIDINNPGLAQNELIEITNTIEELCPVGKMFGVEGIGEGVVWIVFYRGKKFRFKVKGAKHSVSKTKNLAPVDTEKLNSINEFIDYAVTQNRYEQAIETVFKGEELDIKKLGDVIRWMVNDITEEESDTLADNGLTSKEVNKHISSRSRTMFLKDYNKF